MSDALTQENHNNIYAASKSCKRAFEAGASQQRAPVVARTQYHPPTPKYRPPQKKAQPSQANKGYRRAYSIALPSKGGVGQGNSKAPPNNQPCFNCNKTGRWARECPYPKKNNQKLAATNAPPGYVHYTTMEEIPSGKVVTASMFLVNHHPTVVLFDSGASHSFMSPTFASQYNQKVVTVEKGSYCISAAGSQISNNQIVREVCILISNREYTVDLVVLPSLGIHVILGMKWMSGHGVLIDTSTRVVMLRDPINKEAFLVPLPRDLELHNTANAIQTPRIEDVPVVCEFLDVFPDDLPGLPPD